MAIAKEIKNDKIEVVNKWDIQVRNIIIIKEDDVEISRTYHRHVIQPFASLKDGNKWTHTDTDISSEDVSVRAIANAAWTDDVKTKYKEFIEAQEI